jgi:hypothetical protein
MARGTALRLVGNASRSEKLLFFNAEGEDGSTIGAVERLVLIIHRVTSSLKF